MENVHAGWRRKLMKYIADTVDFQLEEHCGNSWKI